MRTRRRAPSRRRRRVAANLFVRPAPHPEPGPPRTALPAGGWVRVGAALTALAPTAHASPSTHRRVVPTSGRAPPVRDSCARVRRVLAGENGLLSFPPLPPPLLFPSVVFQRCTFGWSPPFASRACFVFFFLHPLNLHVHRHVEYEERKSSSADRSKYFGMTGCPCITREVKV